MTNVASEHEQANHHRGVLVTGSSRGLGAEVARTFANVCGDRVAVHCRRSRAEADSVRETLNGDGHVVVQGDLASPQDVRTFVGETIEALGRIDVLVNNAALFADDPSTQGRRLSCDVAESSYDLHLCLSAVGEWEVPPRAHHVAGSTDRGRTKEVSVLVS
jgi:NAD(P)-dependent dehydrogenase (short-subunit alcohol dehydrogenase family)